MNKEKLVRYINDEIMKNDINSEMLLSNLKLTKLSFKIMNGEFDND
ncbi:hypothetical protein [Spiroplasma endosymbiont of Colias croceus]